jgi:hypothetical protein
MEPKHYLKLDINCLFYIFSYIITVVVVDFVRKLGCDSALMQNCYQ